MAVRANCPRDQSTSDISIDSIIGLWISKLFQYVIGPFLITFEIAFQKVGEKEEPKNDKHNKKLNQDNGPEVSTPGHSPEPIIIKEVNFSKHRCKMFHKLIN
jgi:hypothetical protein